MGETTNNNNKILPCRNRQINDVVWAVLLGLWIALLYVIYIVYVTGGLTTEIQIYSSILYCLCIPKWNYHILKISCKWVTVTVTESQWHCYTLGRLTRHKAEKGNAALSSIKCQIREHLVWSSPCALWWAASLLGRWDLWFGLEIKTVRRTGAVWELLDHLFYAWDKKPNEIASKAHLYFEVGYSPQ